MISRVRGTLVRRDPGKVEVATAGGVCYEVEVPLSVFEKLPPEGSEVELRTTQVVREDDIMLFGFVDDYERRVFARVMTASGVGPRLALSMLSTMPPSRLVNAISERDVAVLRQIPGLGAKKAEKLAVELADRLDDLLVASSTRETGDRSAREAVGALVALGYSHIDAATAVRRAMEKDGDVSGIVLIKAALSVIGG
jgi:Holliday junction DNA helicase RuvA